MEKTLALTNVTIFMKPMNQDTPSRHIGLSWGGNGGGRRPYTVLDDLGPELNNEDKGRPDITKIDVFLPKADDCTIVGS